MGTTKGNQERKHRRLSGKQEAFCQAYVQHLNASKAATEAGYALPSCRYMGWKNLTSTAIQERIAQIRQEIAGELDINPRRVLAEYSKVAFANVKDYTVATEYGDRVPALAGCSDDELAAVAEIQVEQYTEGGGDEARPVRRTKFKLHNKLGALDALSKHLGLFEADNTQRGKVEAQIVMFGEPDAKRSRHDSQS